MESKDRKLQTKLIEALLFLENRPVNIKYITKVTKTSREVVKESIADLKNRFNKSGSSLVIEENDR